MLATLPLARKRGAQDSKNIVNRPHVPLAMTMPQPVEGMT
jgi:hypothetical protein